MQEEQQLDEQEIKRRVFNNHQENVSMMLTWVGIEEERAAYLGDYRNVLAELADPSTDDWPLVRAALLHIAHSDNLHSEYSRWLGQEISTGFEADAGDNLRYLTLYTQRDRPRPQPQLEERYPIHHQVTPGEATYYYSRAALAVLVRKDDPHRAIQLLEDVDSIFDPRVRYFHPGEGSGFSLEREMDRLPALYERVGRFEDALKITPCSFAYFGWGVHPADVAVRRLNGWVDQLTESGGVSEVERCLDTIYEWLDRASDADEQERDHVGECPTTTRQFWAWYYGHALGRLLAARPSLRTSLLDEIEAGEWDNCWHVAGVLFETTPPLWDQYRQRALKFYSSSDVEYGRQPIAGFGLPGIRPWNSTQPPHLSPQSDLYWAMRVGFADAHSDNASARSVTLADIADSVADLKTISSSTAVHVLHIERNTESLVEDVSNRVMPNDQFRYDLLRERLPTLSRMLPPQAVEHLISALRHRFAKEWDECILCLSKTVESLFHHIFEPKLLEHPESNELQLVGRGPRNSRRTYTPADWNRIQLSGWAGILRTTTKQGRNASLRSALPHAFPNADLDAVVKLNAELEKIAQLRGSSAHGSPDPEQQRAKNADEPWDLVVASDGNGIIAKFFSSLGLAQA